jgi:hypothetical protein
VKEYDNTTRNYLDILETDLTKYKFEYEKTLQEKHGLESQLFESKQLLQNLIASKSELESKLNLLESTNTAKLKLEREITTVREEKDRIQLDLKNKLILKSCEVEGLVKQSKTYKTKMEEYQQELDLWKGKYEQLQLEQATLIPTSPPPQDKKRKFEQVEIIETPKKKKKSEIIVMFSGFKDTEPLCNLEYKSQLTKQIEEMGGIIRPEEKDKYDDTVTHVISAPLVRTIKTLAAAVKKKWIVSPEWVDESYKNNSFLPEDNFGFCRRDDIFDSKKVKMTSGFLTQKAHVTYATQLVEEFGGGSIIEDVKEADMILVDKKDKTQYGVPSYTWDAFMNLIYPKK